jgi:3',5'-nucleoside bisphosphate phosphatase
MLTWITADLHIHTCLSPCADLMMSPRHITTEAVRRQLGLIAITDHNSAENCAAVIQASTGMPLAVLPGMEVCTSEEVHVIALFDRLTSALALQSLVFDNLEGKNDPDTFGLQVIANKDDEVEAFQEKLLIGATTLTLERVVGEIHDLQGLAIAAHIDRESYSVIGQLGFVPTGVDFDALEISENTSDEVATRRFVEYRKIPFMRNSDAHFLSRLARSSTRLLVEKPTVREIRMALHGEQGRKSRVERFEDSTEEM